MTLVHSSEVIAYNLSKFYRQLYSCRQLKCNCSLTSFAIHERVQVLVSTNDDGGGLHCICGRVALQKGCDSSMLAMIVSPQPTVWFVRVIGVIVYISPLTLQRTWATKILNRNTTPTIDATTIDATAQSITIPWDLWTLSYRKTPSIKVPCLSFPMSFTHNLCTTAKRVNDLSCFTLGSPFRVCVKN